MKTGNTMTSVRRTFSGTLIARGIWFQKTFAWNAAGSCRMKSRLKARMGISSQKQLQRKPSIFELGNRPSFPLLKTGPEVCSKHPRATIEDSVQFAAARVQAPRRWLCVQAVAEPSMISSTTELVIEIG